MSMMSAAGSLYLYRLKRGDAANIVKLPKTHLPINENDNATMNCDIGRLTPGTINTVKWLKDGKTFRQIDINHDDDANKINVSNQQYQSDNVMPREDGRYLKIKKLFFYFNFFHSFLARVVVSSKNGSLTLMPVLSADTGVYECILQNDRSELMSSLKTELKVIEQLKFVPQPTSKNLELGTVAKVHCKVQGTPTPTVKWNKVCHYLPTNDGRRKRNGK